MVWRVGAALVGSTPASEYMDLLASLIAQSNEMADEEALRVTAEGGRVTADGLRDEAEADRAVADAARDDAEANRAFFEAYNAGTAYVIGNKVAYLGSSYYCIADAPAATLPTNVAFFQLMASKGDKGDQGDQGIQGIQGIQGPAGGAVVLDDTTTAANKVWSSSKVSSDLASNLT